MAALPHIELAKRTVADRCSPLAAFGSSIRIQRRRARTRRPLDAGKMSFASAFVLTIISITSLLIIVPIKLNQCHQLVNNNYNNNQQQPKAIQSSRLDNTFIINQQPFIENWALRINNRPPGNNFLQAPPRPSYQQQQQLKNVHLAMQQQPIKRRTNELQHELSASELQQILGGQVSPGSVLFEQEYQPKAARQLFITDLIQSNQSHRSLLKNLVNSTIADLVSSRQQIGALNLKPRRFTTAGAPNQSAFPMAADEMLLSNQLNANRQQQHLDQLQLQTSSRIMPAIGQKLYSFLFPNNNNNQQQQQQQQQQSNLRDSLMMGEHGELIEPSSSDSMEFYDFKQSSNQPDEANLRLALDAGSSSKKFISLSAPYDPRPRPASIIGNGNAAAFPAYDLTSNESRAGKWRRDKPSSLSPSLGLTTNANFIPYDQPAQANASGGENHFSSTIEGSNEEDPRLAPMAEVDSQPEIVQQEAQQQQPPPQPDDEQSKSGSYSSFNSSQNGENPNDSYVKFVDEDTGNLLEFESQSNAQDAVDLSPANQEGENLHSSAAGNFLNHQMDTQQSVGNHQHQLVGRGLMQNHSRGANEANANGNDSSFLAAQLPRSYDSSIRLPPEGYYDDYYKLAPSQANAALYPTSESLISDQYHPMAMNGNVDGYLSYSDHQQQQQQLMTSTDPPDNHQLDHPIGQFNNPTPPSGKSNLMDSNQVNQFYSNQTPLRQNDVSSDQNIEFIVPNRTTAANQLQAAAANASARKQSNSNQTTGADYQPLMMLASANNRTTPNNNHTNHHLAHDDNLQVIIANTNSSFDPVSNEKVITYMREGQNVTFQASSNKSPRNTFVNKEMNELPPTIERQNQSNGSSDQQQQQEQQQERLPLQLSDSQVTSTTTPASFSLASYLREGGGEAPREADEDRYSSSKHAREAATGARAREGSQPDSAASDDDDSETLRRLSSDDQNYGQYNRANRHTAQRMQRTRPTNSGGTTITEKRPTGRNHEQINGSGGGGSNRDRTADAGKLSAPPNRRRRQNTRQQQQQTIRRPQITQAQFELKDLALNEPTARPSVTESAIETITELPSKVRKFRENQPDKNELMNELLTALDRVKVAIYKLQPLTAKMNAIYRKSVTSNTRDTILDSYKGTYAKRYPPGDYDDSYDKMHPSELLTRKRPAPIAASSRKGRRASGSSSARHQQQQQHLDGPKRMDRHQAMVVEESATRATYVPAPRELAVDAANFKRNETSTTIDSDQMIPFSTTIEIDGLKVGESNQIIAAGIGRRLGDGRPQDGVSSLDSQSLSNRDDEFNRQQKLMSTEELSDRLEPPADEFEAGANLGRSPDFGYRITIYQSPEEGSDGQEQVSEFSNLDDGNNPSASESLSYSVDESDAGGLVQVSQGDDVMATSESSLVETVSEMMPAASSVSSNATKAIVGPDSISSSSSSSLPLADAIDQELMDEGESQEKRKKMEKWKKKGEKDEKKEAKEKGGKQQEKQAKSKEKKKKGEEESKKKKEYKKIKHNKGLVSKESKKMHRDKHIKAHDRGAAKEKALKERTQIEFFEREQIVDDEFEKGKKSTMKAGWQSGHDSKKSTKDIAGGDSMSMGGSHYVAHEQPVFTEKGHGSSAESSSAKQSNKFEKKDMESKGKKFKGWREKGYKIITETEFIDRGSLHDSAYKKRDKGAAHHQKYKKQEASSEGHQGSMQEHHRKSLKKEEKQEKMHEKKEKHLKKNEGEEKKGKKKEHGEKKKMMEKVGKEEADEEESMLAATIRPSDEVIDMMNRNQRSKQPVMVESRAFDFGPNRGASVDDRRDQRRPQQQQQQQQPAALMRLLNVEHDTTPARLIASQYSSQTAANLSTRNTASLADNNQHHNSQMNVARANVDEEISIRRSDGPPRPANATILDIVDNFTGQKMNKTRVGTYELEDQRLAGRINQRPVQPKLVPQPFAKSLSELPQESRAAQQNQPRPNSAATAGTTAATKTSTMPTTTPTTTQTPRQMALGDTNRELVSLLQGEQRAQNQHREQLANGQLSNLFAANQFNANQLMASQQQPTVGGGRSGALYMHTNAASPQSSVGLAAQALLYQLAQRAAASNHNSADMISGNFAPTASDQLQQQTSFLPQLPGPPPSMGSHLAPPQSSYQQQQQQFEFLPTASGQHASNGLFPSSEHLFDYDSDILSSHGFTAD